MGDVGGGGASVHLGGVLTLPGAESNMPRSLSPRHPSLGRRIAEGCREIERLVGRYNVKSGDADIAALARRVRASVLRPSNSTVQMEKILGEMMLSFLRISSCWVSLSSVLELPRERLCSDESAETLTGAFLHWQERSRWMLDAIVTALRTIPREYEKRLFRPAKATPKRWRAHGRRFDPQGNGRREETRPYRLCKREERASYEEEEEKEDEDKAGPSFIGFYGEEGRLDSRIDPALRERLLEVLEHLRSVEVRALAGPQADVEEIRRVVVAPLGNVTYWLRSGIYQRLPPFLRDLNDVFCRARLAAKGDLSVLLAANSMEASFASWLTGEMAARDSYH